MKAIIMLSILCSLRWTAVDAQILKPVKWSYAAKKNIRYGSHHLYKSDDGAGMAYLFLRYA